MKRPGFIDRMLGYGREAARVNEYVIVPSLPYGTHCYIISKAGAQKLITLFERDGIYDAVDAQIQRYARRLNVYLFNPLLAFQHVSVRVSTVNELRFPKVLNNILDQYKTEGATSYAYIMSNSKYAVGRLHCNFWLWLSLSSTAVLWKKGWNGRCILLLWIILYIIDGVLACVLFPRST